MHLVRDADLSRHGKLHIFGPPLMECVIGGIGERVPADGTIVARDGGVYFARCATQEAVAAAARSTFTRDGKAPIE